MKLLRTIAFDGSDVRVFDRAAAPGEWAVSGAFQFVDLAPAAVTGKLRQAFANGFLGVSSSGRSTFVSVASATQSDADQATARLADSLVADHGAPSLEAALAAARGEIADAAGLADGLAINTVLAVRRTFADDGSIREEFRTFRPPSGAPQHARIWTIEGEDA